VNPSLGANAITRCFNSQLPASLASNPPCGFVYHAPASGLQKIDFGFEVDDRFYVATSTGSGTILGACATSDASSFTPPFNQCAEAGATSSLLSFYAFQPATGNHSDAIFNVLVY
jgi:hypothetical protein